MWNNAECSAAPPGTLDYWAGSRPPHHCDAHENYTQLLSTGWNFSPRLGIFKTNHCKASAEKQKCFVLVPFEHFKHPEPPTSPGSCCSPQWLKINKSIPLHLPCLVTWSPGSFHFPCPSPQRFTSGVNKGLRNTALQNLDSKFSWKGSKRLLTQF